MDIPIEELAKYLTQEEVCTLSLVSKGFKEKLKPLYEKFKRFLNGRAHRISFTYDCYDHERFDRLTFILHDYSSGSDAIIQTKTRGIPKKKINTFADPDIETLIKYSAFNVKIGDIIGYVVNNRRKESRKSDSYHTYFYYMQGRIIRLNDWNPIYDYNDQVRLRDDLFSLEKYSHLYWLNIPIINKHSIDTKKMDLFFNEMHFIEYVEIKMDGFRYRIYCAAAVTFRDYQTSMKAIITMGKIDKSYKIMEISSHYPLRKI